MARRFRTRRRRRGTAERTPSFAGILMYAAGLVLLNVLPGWEVLPFLTTDAVPVMALANLALIVGLLGQAMFLVDDRPRLRALVTYVLCLIWLAVLAQALILFPFDIGSWDVAWATTIEWVLLALVAWDVWVACKAAVRLVQGRRLPRLAASHA